MAKTARRVSGGACPTAPFAPWDFQGACLAAVWQHWTPLFLLRCCCSSPRSCHRANPRARSEVATHHASRNALHATDNAQHAPETWNTNAKHKGLPNAPTAQIQTHTHNSITNNAQAKKHHTQQTPHTQHTHTHHTRQNAQHATRHALHTKRSETTHNTQRI